MPRELLSPWGRVLGSEQEVLSMPNRFAAIPALPPEAPHVLPYGNGRSYGDSCMNVGGTILKTRRLDRFIAFDRETGVLACESGMLLSDILELVVPKGWFLPVTPGTRFVTVGGAIANDVHGKNHHVAGTFGRHVRRFELLRSDGQRLICSDAENREYFAATIGGLGLTGLITWAEIQLRPINNPWIDVETIRYKNVEEFFALCRESDRYYEYTVSWVDCLSKGKYLGRGLFMRGNHAPGERSPGRHNKRTLTFPFLPPVSLINGLSLKVFNTLYYRKQLRGLEASIQHYEPFFYPLDSILEWNRIYGPRGFYQYQCVVPTHVSEDATRRLLGEIAQSGYGSFLAVIKCCGALVSPGLLSFPQHGVTLAIDFPNRDASLHKLFSRLDTVVREVGGRIYVAKDARMSGATFREGYPAWKIFAQYIDPRFSSSFWRRVMADV